MLFVYVAGNKIGVPNGVICGVGILIVGIGFTNKSFVVVSVQPLELIATAFIMKLPPEVNCCAAGV